MCFGIKPYGAGNETRTRDPDLGKVVLYQLSYSRLVKMNADLSYKSSQIFQLSNKNYAETCITNAILKRIKVLVILKCFENYLLRLSGKFPVTTKYLHVELFPDL